MKISAQINRVNNVSLNQFEIWGLLQTWITPVELHGFKRSPQLLLSLQRCCGNVTWFSISTEAEEITTVPLRGPEVQIVGPDPNGS